MATPDPTPEPHLPPPEPGNRRHRAFGPASNAHTDACIRDAARYGFCDHTRLGASPARVRVQTRHRERSRRASIIRELLGFVSLAMIFGPFFYLANQLAIIEALLIFTLLTCGYLLLLLCGIPSSLTVDPREWIPDDARERLENPLPKKPKGPPR